MWKFYEIAWEEDSSSNVPTKALYRPDSFNDHFREWYQKNSASIFVMFLLRDFVVLIVNMSSLVFRLMIPKLI